MSDMTTTENSLQSTEIDDFYSDLSTKDYSLQEKILNGRQNGTSDKFNFFPDNGVRLLPTVDVIRAELDEYGVDIDEQLLDFLVDDAKRLFLILSSIEMTAKIPSFLKYKFHDGCLPIKLQNKKDERGRRLIQFNIGSLDEITNEMKPETPSCFKAFSGWRNNDLKLFEQEQWQFLAPVFTSNPLHHNMHEKRPLPFITYDLEFKTGFFGQVNKARIHRAHQLVSVRGHKPLTIAVKKLQRDGAQRFLREAKPLDIISKLDHPHLIKPIATYQHGDSFCFLFPWAEGGNLIQFWAKDKYPGMTDQNDELLLWSLEQLGGLAGGLAELYNKNGRHGDLKPENILLFPNGNSRGVLQITDMGLTKFHVEATRSRRILTNTKTGTSRYEPPECEEDDESKPRSRDYDVWSMGCIYLEYLIWLLDGQEAVGEFTRRGNFEHFWEGRKYQYKIHPLVQERIDSLSKRLDTGSTNSENALKDILELIRTRLLKVKLAGDYTLSDVSNEFLRTETRANAVELYDEISKIYKRAKEDPSYIELTWTRPKRKGHTSNQLVVPVVPNQPRTEFLPPARTFSGIEGKDNPEVIISPDEQDRRLNDDWETVLDNKFSAHVHEKVGQIPQQDNLPMARLCNRCQSMNIWEPGFKLEYTASDLVSDSENCDLCNLFYESIRGSELAKQSPIIFNRVESRFISGKLGTTVLSIYYDTMKPQPSDRAQLGFPVLPAAGDERQISILQEWIRDCDENHKCLPKDVLQGTSPLPTRVIDVGESANPILRLINKDRIKGERYVALSHSWGTLHASKNFCTRKENIQQYQERIDEDDLPKTFRDAVKITRALNVRYLWIDSLCIIQNDADDWDAESVRMEDVFSSAYFTIAASSAPSSHAGFLETRQKRPYINLDTSTSGSIYLCKGIDNFQVDVEQSILSSRGWVLQERALSRRSIYFTSNQVYWECGDGVRCETLAKLKNSKAAFLGDSNFPNMSEEYYKGGKILLFQHLFKTYSRLSFTKPEDRPVAITGLEKRLGRTYGTRGGYGIFERFFGRGLLWKCGNDSPLKRIEFPATRQVPSWSWMAYQGGIDYLDISWDDADWTDDLKNPFEYKTTAQNKRHWDSEHRDKPLELVADARELVIEDIEFATRVDFDDFSKHDQQSVRCVVVGKKKRANSERSRIYWVLIIKVATSNETGRFYERVGVGSLLGEHIKWDQSESVIIR